MFTKTPPLLLVFLCIFLQDLTVVVEADNERNARSVRVSEFSSPAAKPGHRFIVSNLTMEFEYLVGSCPQDGNVNLRIGISDIVVHSRILVDNHCRFCLVVEVLIFLIFYIGDAGNTPLVDVGTPLGATTVVTPESAGYLLWECCILASL